MAQLMADMKTVDSKRSVIDVTNFVEGTWLHKKDDTYYRTYGSMGRGRETISYATASSKEGPWTFQGLLNGMADNSFTIHPGIIEFNDHWYLFYHNASLNIGEINGAICRRSVCVDELIYNTDGTMQQVEQTLNGVSLKK